MATSLLDAIPVARANPPTAAPAAPERLTYAAPAGTGRLRRVLRTLGLDLGYVLPGAFLSVASFGILLTLVVVGAATFVVWIGVVILPLSLVIATWFAQVSRMRLRGWGVHVVTPAYRPAGTGLGGWLAVLKDSRRWLDLVFEMVLAPLLRLANFVITVTWSAVALGGLSYFFWGTFLPNQANTGLRLALARLPESWISPSFAASFAAEAIAMAMLGVLCLLTFPAVMRVLARMDATATATALGSDGTSPTTGP